LLQVGINLQELWDDRIDLLGTEETELNMLSTLDNQSELWVLEYATNTKKLEMFGEGGQLPILPDPSFFEDHASRLKWEEFMKVELPRILQLRDPNLPMSGGEITIELKPDAVPYTAPPRRYSPKQEEYLRRWLTELREPTVSAWRSPNLCCK
jgi:hypothetical protein